MADEWQKYSIGELCELGVASVQTGPFGSQLHAHEYVADGIPVVSTEAIFDRHIDRSLLHKITPEKAQSLDRHKLLAGDILFARRGVQATGHVGYVRPVEEGFMCGTGAIRLRLRPDNDLISPEFLSHVLANPESVEWFKFHAIGATMPNLNESIIRRFIVALPPLPEQRAIAHILGTLDDKIEVNRRMNRTLEAMARALFQSWFVEFDPVRAKARGEAPPGLAPELAALFPDRLVETEMGEAPEGWEIGCIKDCCISVQNGGTPKRSEPSYWEPKAIPWLTSGEVRQPLVVETENLISERGLQNSSAKWVPEDSTVVALYGATAGQVSFIAKRLTTNQAVCSLVPQKEYRYFNYLSMAGSVNQLANLARGSAQQNISKGIVETFRVIRPIATIVEAFDTLLDPLFRLRIANLAEIATLAELRDTLLPKLMSGAVRVPDAAEMAGI